MITIIVVAFNPGAEIRECIASAKRIRNAEVLIWDNSTDSTAWGEFADVIGGCTLLGDGTNHGFGRANNLAAAAAGQAADFFLFLNPDCVIDQVTVDKLTEVMRDSSVAAAAPLMRYANGELGISGGPFPMIVKEILSELRIYERLPERYREFALQVYDRVFVHGKPGFGADHLGDGTTFPDWISGFCMMVRAEDFAKVGGFSDEYFLYFEDVDLCYRIRLLGKRCALVRSAVALHHESTTTGASSEGKAIHYAEGRSVYFRLNGGKVGSWGADRLRDRARKRARRPWSTAS